MADDDPDAPDADEGVDDLPEYGRRDPAVDNKAKESACEHGDDACADERKIRHVKAA